jgi:hypothetical protein
MPEVSVYKNDDSLTHEDYVRASEHRSHVQAKTVTALVKQASEVNLRLCVRAAHLLHRSRHNFGIATSSHCIRHSDDAIVAHASSRSLASRDVSFNRLRRWPAASREAGLRRWSYRSDRDDPHSVVQGRQLGHPSAVPNSLLVFGRRSDVQLGDVTALVREEHAKSQPIDRVAYLAEQLAIPRYIGEGERNLCSRVRVT